MWTEASAQALAQAPAQPRLFSAVHSTAAPPATVHLIYPHGPSSACPHAIGRHLGRLLARRWRVRHYDLTHPDPIRPGPGDILLGHPDAACWSVLRSSIAHPLWHRRLLLAPFTHGDLQQWAFVDRLLPRCDRLLAITGSYWNDTLAGSAYAHWAPRFVHLDLAVDTSEFTNLKTGFGPPGRRPLVYIGHRAAYKNLPYLSALAQRLPGQSFHWIGDAAAPLRQVHSHGRQDFATAQGRSLIAGFDFLITVGRADPNPATILEAMAWGLIPVCTRESGYHREPGIINLPLDDLEGAAAILERLQQLPDAELQGMAAINRRRLAEHYTWERFAQVVEQAIDAPPGPPLLPRSLGNRLRLRWADLTASQSGLRPHNLRRGLMRRLGQRRVPHPCCDPAACATLQPGQQRSGPAHSST